MAIQYSGNRLEPLFTGYRRLRAPAATSIPGSGSPGGSRRPISETEVAQIVRRCTNREGSTGFTLLREA